MRSIDLERRGRGWKERRTTSGVPRAYAALAARTVRIMHRPRMQSACGTNLAPECLRMDGIAPLLLSASFYTAPFRRRLMHVRTSCTQRYSRGSTKYSVPRRRQTRARVNVPRGSLVSFSYPLIAPRFHGLPLTRSFRLCFSLYRLATSPRSGFFFSPLLPCIIPVTRCSGILQYGSILHA